MRAVSRTRLQERALVRAARRQPDTQAFVHQHFHTIGAAVGKQISTVWNTASTRARAVSVPARMSIVSVASQMESMRIIATGFEERLRWQPRFRSASSL